MAISQYPALFSLLGTSYGGDGINTFALPNLQGRVPVGMGNGAGLPPYDIGQMGGATTITLTTNQMPMHTHSSQLNATSTGANIGNASNALLATQPRNGGTNIFAVGNADVRMASQAVEIGPAGSSQPINIMPPYVAVNYLIALTGIYPSRN